MWFTVANKDDDEGKKSGKASERNGKLRLSAGVLEK
jgi:hypothetical protein